MTTTPSPHQLAPRIAAMIPAIRELSRSEKFQVARMLLDDLAGQEPPPMFPEGHVFPIHTPEYSPDAATQLARVLLDEGNVS